MKYVEYMLIFELVIVQSHASHTKDIHYSMFSASEYSLEIEKFHGFSTHKILLASHYIVTLQVFYFS